MCCLRINTDVILSQLFALSSYPISFTMEDIKKFFRVLSERFPIYLTTNLSEYAVVMCTKLYPELYNLSYNENKVIIVRSGKNYPNLDFFMESYTQGVRNYMKIITKEFLNNLKNK